MKTRIISAIFMLPIALFIFLKGYPLLIFCFICSMVAMYEFYKGFQSIDSHPNYFLGVVALIALYAIVVWGEFSKDHEQRTYAHLLCIWVTCVVMGGLLEGLFNKSDRIFDGLLTSLGALYIGFFMVHIPCITRISMYKEFVWLVFISAFGSDVFAYFSGFFFGKHKLCPTISPKKTIEGSIGGVVGSAMLCMLFGFIFYPSINFLHFMTIGVLGSAFSQCGDLVASMFKRKMGIKDYGDLIPGHGGVLDRFDSVLFTAPFVYYYILIILRP